MAEYSPEQYLASLLTTPEQEARNLRASRSRQRILALGDALRHIGNIYNTTQGAPAQQFNDPVTAERTRYQQDKLLRDANNMKYFSYQQAKQAQDAKQRQWEATFNYNAAKDAANAQALKDYRDARMKADRDKWNEQLAFNRDKWRDQSDLNERKFDQQTKHQNTMAGIAAQNAATNRGRLEWQKGRGGGSGSGSGGYTLPTMNGSITLSRDFNSNDIGQSALRQKITPYLTPSQKSLLDSPFITLDQKRIAFDDGISQWLMNDPTAATYMQTHYNATINQSQVPSNYDDYIETDDEEDEDYSEFEVK